MSPLGPWLPVAPGRNLAILVEVAARNDSGRVSRLRLSGMRPAAITGEQFRAAVGATDVRSTAFASLTQQVPIGDSDLDRLSAVDASFLHLEDAFGEAFRGPGGPGEPNGGVGELVGRLGCKIGVAIRDPDAQRGRLRRDVRVQRAGRFEGPAQDVLHRLDVDRTLTRSCTATRGSVCSAHTSCP